VSSFPLALLVAVEAGAVAVRLSELRVRYRKQNFLDDDI
jgi:hypothetical protein